jgi:Mg2+ and Co2+ transporter CorA
MLAFALPGAPKAPDALPAQTLVTPAEAAASKGEIKDQPLGKLLEAWRKMVADHRVDFHEHARQVAAWDSHLRQAHVDLHDLECSVEQLQQDSKEVDSRLRSVEGTMDQMAEQLDHVEQHVERLLGQYNVGDMTHGQAQRARMGAYGAALELDDMLQHLEEKLETIEREMLDDQQELSAEPVRGASSLATLSLPISARARERASSRLLCPSHPQLAVLRNAARAEESNLQLLQEDADRVLKGSDHLTAQLGRWGRGGGAFGGGGW